MDAEQLKMITEAIGGLGADAKSAFIFYIVAWAIVDLGGRAIVGGSIIWSIYLVLWLVRNMIRIFCASAELARAAGFELHHDVWSPLQLEQACKVLQKYCKED